MSESAGLYGNLDFVNQAEREYFEEARLGVEASNFCHSELGRYLHGRAKMEMDEARDGILQLNPFDPKDQIEMAKLQAQAACGEAFMRWIVDLVNNGLLAEQQLSEYNQ